MKAMQSIMQHPYSKTFHHTEKKISAWKKFIHWSVRQGEYRLGWAVFIIAGHGCVFTTLTALSVLLTGNHFIFWPFVIGSMIMAVLVVIAGMPTKIMIPIFFFSLLIDLIVITTCLLNGFHMEAVYR